MKRLVLVVGVLGVVCLVTLALVARFVLTGENVRAAVAGQLSAALGQPVTIGDIGASVFPRVTMDLTRVAVGQPARIELGSVHLATGLRGLLSRRIEDAAVRVEGARIRLPLPPFGGGHADAGATGAAPPVEIVSVNEIVLRDVEVESGGRTLKGDVEIVPQKDGIVLRRASLAADETRIEMTGSLTALSPLRGRVDAKATSVDLDRLLAFLGDFAAASGATSGSANTSPPGAGGLTFVLAVDRATTGGLAFSDLAATATIAPGTVRFDPFTCRVFGGRYDGPMQLTLGEVPQFRWQAKVAGIDAAALMAFAQSPDTVSGTLAGTVSLAGDGLTMEQALRTGRGTARIDISDGAIAGLALVRTIITATSGRGGLLTSASAAATTPRTSGSERFSRLGATLRLDRGVIATDDFSMTSQDVDLAAIGTLRLANMTANFDGKARLSEALSKQAGTDLYRYAQEGGRVTLPVDVTGPIQALSVRVDISQAATRAIRNRANEEIKKALERNLPGGLGGLIRRRPSP